MNIHIHNNTDTWMFKLWRPRPSREQGARDHETYLGVTVVTSMYAWGCLYRMAEWYPPRFLEISSCFTRNKCSSPIIVRGLLAVAAVHVAGSARRPEEGAGRGLHGGGWVGLETRLRLHRLQDGAGHQQWLGIPHQDLHSQEHLPAPWQWGQWNPSLAKMKALPYQCLELSEPLVRCSP